MRGSVEKASPRARPPPRLRAAAGPQAGRPAAEADGWPAAAARWARDEEPGLVALAEPPRRSYVPWTMLLSAFLTERVLRAGALASFLLLLAGCGDSDSDEESMGGFQPVTGLPSAQALGAVWSFGP